MRELHEYFQGYFQLYLSEIKWIILFSFVFLAFFYILHRKGIVKEHRKATTSWVLGALWSLACSFVFVMTLYGRQPKEETRYVLQPLYSYVDVFGERNVEVFLQILINIVMFIPLGFLLPCCFKVFAKYRYVVIMLGLSSFLIELLQLILKIGLFEIDDIINNVIGASIGLGIYALCKMVKNRVKS